MKVPVLPLKIPIYKNNGLGRDTYISFYNGGFGNYKYSRSYKKDNYNIPLHKYHPDLFKRRPIDKYQISGEGRDYFIYKGIQTEHDRISGNNTFENILRKDDSPIEYFMSTKRPRNKFEKILINRIFYGKSSMVKDRQMCPKVKFKKDIEKEKNIINDTNFLRTENSKVNNITNLKNSFLKTSKDNETGNLFNITNSKKVDLMMTHNNDNRKKNLIENNNNRNESQDLINSVKKIFLYNSKNKIGTESY